MPGSKLKKADLSGAKFVDAHLEVSDFTEANLIGARFQKTYLQSSNFTKSELSATYFENTNLESSDFTDANLQSAIITGTDLHEVTLIGANLSEVILLNVDMSKTRGLLVKQLQNRTQPFICKVTLPPSIKINPNRDCKLLPNELLKRDPMSYKTLRDAEDYVNK
jgi:Pentapeptide repeats (9 copies)/Pentapeptide repeats (8 copies)